MQNSEDLESSVLSGMDFGVSDVAVLSVWSQDGRILGRWPIAKVSEITAILSKMYRPSAVHGPVDAGVGQKRRDAAMKQFKAWRYKCDFCGKNGYSAGHMRSHERHCTANPDRLCRIHKHADLRIDNPGPMPVSELLAVLRSHWCDEDHGVGALRVAAEDCPCCMLAAIRQSGACNGCVDEDGYAPPWIGTDRFDFKGELKTLWETVNQRGYESGL